MTGYQDNSWVFLVILTQNLVPKTTCQNLSIWILVVGQKFTRCDTSILFVRSATKLHLGYGYWIQKFSF